MIRIVVDAISPNSIDQNGGFDPLLITEDVDEQWWVLPALKETGEDGQRGRPVNQRRRCDQGWSS